MDKRSIGYNKILDKDKETVESSEIKVSLYECDEYRFLKNIDSYDSMLLSKEQMKELNEKIEGVKFVPNKTSVTVELSDGAGVTVLLLDMSEKAVEEFEK